MIPLHAFLTNFVSRPIQFSKASHSSTKSRTIQKQIHKEKRTKPISSSALSLPLSNTHSLSPISALSPLSVHYSIITTVPVTRHHYTLSLPHLTLLLFHILPQRRFFAFPKASDSVHHNLTTIASSTYSYSPITYVQSAKQ